MTEQTVAIVVGGLVIVALGGLASYMADRQRRQEITDREVGLKQEDLSQDHSL